MHTRHVCCSWTVIPRRSHGGQGLCFTRPNSTVFGAYAAGGCGGAQERRGRRRGVSAAGTGGPVAAKIQGSPCHTFGSARHGVSRAASCRASSCCVNDMTVLTSLVFTLTLQTHAFMNADVSHSPRAALIPRCLSSILSGNTMSRGRHGTVGLGTHDVWPIPSAPQPVETAR